MIFSFVLLFLSDLLVLAISLTSRYNEPMKFYVVAGEKSGDKQGALLMEQLRLHQPEIEFEGLGGERMHALSPSIENWTEQAAVIGFIEVFKHLRYFKSHLDRMTERIVQEKPDALILIDYPGFNQRLAQRVHDRCPETKIIWFIAPMVWAWHKGRIPKLAAMLDLMLCTFPFEKKLFEDAGLHTEFVGHPLVDDILAQRDLSKRESRLIGLFPGSRRREVERIFPVFLDIIKLAQEKRPEWRFVCSASSAKMEALMERMREDSGLAADCVNITPERYHELMDRSQAALVTSGTATLEAALHQLPFALVYKVPALTYLMAKLLLKIRFIGMVNILVDRAVTRELIQHDFTPERCLVALDELLDEQTRSRVMDEMQESIDLLGQGGAAAKAASAVMSLFPQKD